MEFDTKMWDMKMSPLEKRLKEYLKNHKEYQNQILTAEELSDFTLRMLAENPNEPEDELLDFFNGEYPEFFKKLLVGRSDKSTNKISDPATLSAFFQSQPESDNVPVGFDIFVARVFRYMPVHWHTNHFFTVFFCLNGECPILLSDETVKLHSGDVMILAPNAFHASPCYGDDCVLIYYMIRQSTFYDVFWSQLSDVALTYEFFSNALQGIVGNPYLLFQTDDDARIRQLFYHIYQELSFRHPHASHIANSIMTLLFLTLFRHYSGSVILSKRNAFHWKQEYSKILQYIQEHFVSVTIQDLTKNFHYSERQINRIIQHCSNRTFSQLRLELRLKKACDLLTNSTMSVVQICDVIGYTNLNAFYKAFTKHTGVSPVQWRKQKQTLS